MNKIVQNTELIDRYLRDQLSDDELAMFNRKMKEDHEFEKLFFEMDQLVAGIRYSSRTSTVEEKLERLEKSLPLMRAVPQHQNIINNFFNTLTEKLNQLLDDLSLRIAMTITQVKLALSGVAATILVALALLISFQRTLSPGVLFTSNLKLPEYENFGATREAGVQNTDPVKARFDEAMVKYNLKDYESALAIINTIPAEQRNPEIKLYDALVNIELENYGVAKQILTDLKGNVDESWANRARWYLGLCLIRENNFDDARTLLTQVRDFGGIHAKDASKLLKKIK